MKKSQPVVIWNICIDFVVFWSFHSTDDEPKCWIFTVCWTYLKKLKTYLYMYVVWGNYIFCNYRSYVCSPQVQVSTLNVTQRHFCHWLLILCLMVWVSFLSFFLHCLQNYWSLVKPQILGSVFISVTYLVGHKFHIFMAILTSIKLHIRTCIKFQVIIKCTTITELVVIDERVRSLQ